MSKEDLISLKGNDDPRSVAIRAKLKGSSSKKRKLAQKISAIPRMSKKTLDKNAMEIVNNPDVSALQIIKVVKELLLKNLTDRTKVELVGKMIQAHTAIHGIKSKNINLNIDVTCDKVVERLKNWKKNEIISMKDGTC